MSVNYGADFEGKKDLTSCLSRYLFLNFFPCHQTEGCFEQIAKPSSLSCHCVELSCLIRTFEISFDLAYFWMFHLKAVSFR